MGFWGTFVVARDARPLPTLAGVRELADHIVWHGAGQDGWQAVQLHRAPDDWRPPMTAEDGRESLLESLVEQTGQPVLAAVVLDSDGAQLIGYSPRAGRWSSWLSLEAIVDYLDSQYSDRLDVDDDEELPEDLDEFWKNRYREACRPLYELAPPSDIAAPHAVAWAAEAGYAPSVAAVEAALGGGAVLVEDQFFTLLAALGLPKMTAVAYG
ncbi:hypothetical protein Pa4123_81600 [Phytohabitans aurantiacus]|uniref:Uncharacterized protein n=1 Tax=Phytohabitans aurantiacus TaxID=3016789 RepID=A0ABQ5R7Y6_9ACTN|nr:hypothetical protein Pa4123_81600 [Phytohabitans aurantiacus]